MSQKLEKVAILLAQNAFGASTRVAHDRDATKDATEAKKLRYYTVTVNVGPSVERRAASHSYVCVTKDAPHSHKRALLTALHILDRRSTIVKYTTLM